MKSKSVLFQLSLVLKIPCHHFLQHHNFNYYPLFFIKIVNIYYHPFLTCILRTYNLASTLTISMKLLFLKPSVLIILDFSPIDYSQSLQTLRPVVYWASQQMCLWHCTLPVFLLFLWPFMFAVLHGLLFLCLNFKWAIPQYPILWSLLFSPSTLFWALSSIPGDSTSNWWPLHFLICNPDISSEFHTHLPTRDSHSFFLSDTFNSTCPLQLSLSPCILLLSQ